MKSVLITFDQAYYERIMRCSTVWVVVALHTLRKCRDVVRKQAIRISEPCLAKYVLGYLDGSRRQQSRSVARHLAYNGLGNRTIRFACICVEH